MAKDTRAKTGLSPSLTPCSKGLSTRPTPKHPLQITTRTLKEPDFKFELLPLHSPLLGQSLLVSFPPLIDMLKFSGYSYLIRGQLSEKLGGFYGDHPLIHPKRGGKTTALGVLVSMPLNFRACRFTGSAPTPSQRA